MILEQSGSWVAFEAAGWLGYTGNASDGSRLEITCDVAHTLTPGPGGVSVMIADYEPRPGAEVRLSTAGESITATTGRQAGWIAGRNCPGCEETFRAIWTMLRSGDVLVMEAEGRRATLPLEGAAALMPPDFCPVGGDRSLDTPSGAAPASDLAGGPPGATDPSVVRRLQEALNVLGYDAGPADGLAGPRTHRALSLFQRDNGLLETGAPDPGTIELLLAETGAEASTADIAAPNDMTFDCDGALTPTQLTVCADPVLRRLDADLAEAQRARLATASGAEAAEERQLQPIRSRLREECGTDAACIEERYAADIALIRMLLPAPPPAATLAAQPGSLPGRERAGRESAPVIVARGEIPAPLTAFRDCDVCPEMMALPAGSFWMGATEEDAALLYVDISSETPRHEVVIDYGFAIGRFNVTVAEFAAFVEETGHAAGGPCLLRLPDSGPNAGRFLGTIHPLADEFTQGTTALGLGGMVLVEHADYRTPGTEVTDDQPATCISRNEVMAYLAWLSDRAGRAYRLPTEAEWEYAVRAGEERPFFWGGGQQELCAYGNFADRDSVYSAAIAARCAEEPSLEYTYPVGSFEPNAWGLFDMVGNVFEFVEDCFFPTYDGAPADGSPWMESDRHPDYMVGEDCQLWATRGYFFDSPDVALRSAARCIGISSWDDRANALGLRVAVSLSDGAWDLKRAAP